MPPFCAVYVRPTFVRARTGVHVRTYFHAEATVATQIGDGYERMSYIECTHHHTAMDDADTCATRLERILATGRMPKWARDLVQERNPE